jgi:CHAD domain-containing protein
MDTASPLPSSTRPQTLQSFVEEQTATRLRRLAFELRKARQSMDEERVHDLRVAVRRLMETLRLAAGVLPDEGVKDVLEDLRKIMKAAGEVRSCDIARELLCHAGASEGSPVLSDLAEQRRLAEGRLFERAHHTYQRNLTQRWRAALMPRAAPLARRRR